MWLGLVVSLNRLGTERARGQIECFREAVGSHWVLGEDGGAEFAGFPSGGSRIDAHVADAGGDADHRAVRMKACAI